VKKVLISLVALIGAFSLLISIFIFPNLVKKSKPGTIITTLDIVQRIDVEIESASSSGYYLTTVYSTGTFKMCITFPSIDDLIEDYGIEINNGSTNKIIIDIPAVFLLDERYYGGFFSSFWATEQLGNVFTASLLANVTNNNGVADYSDIKILDYYTTFNSSTMLKMFTWVIEAQEEAKENAPELQKPEYNADGNEYNAIYNGFVFIGDMFDYVLNYIKFIYAYIQIPIELYFVE
jgi:hypothetical protein